jgi:phosphate transport system substrate-binding protein
MKELMVLLMALLFCNCAHRDKNGNILDTPTSGFIAISADESLKPLIDAEVNAFEGIYQYAKIKVVYTNEEDAVNWMLQDSARLTIVTRKLVSYEMDQLMRQTIVPTQLKIAGDGIALIQNRNDVDSLISLEHLKRLLSGDLNGGGDRKVSPVRAVVFDQPNSGIIRYLQDSLRVTGSLPNYCFAVHGNAAVVDYVSKKPGTLGMIDLSWISDCDDSISNSFLKTIRVLGVSRDSDFYQPYQAYLAENKYPLQRDVVMISREARSGLASGFMAFVASDRGQRIVLKSGLVPATMPIRIVEISHEPF